jgi:ribosomal protein S6
LTSIYETMFLLDNEVVREDYQAAKSLVSGIVEKHGGTVHTSRRWDERRLAYPIKGRQRATYLLTHFEIARGGIPTMLRDFELNENILRVQSLRVEVVPEGEEELSAAEQADEFTIPAPPEDDAPEPEEEAVTTEFADEGRRPAAAESADKAEAATTDKTVDDTEATSESTPGSDAQASTEATSEPAPDSDAQASTEATSEPAPDSDAQASTEATSEPAPDSDAQASTEATSESTPDSDAQASTEGTSETAPDSDAQASTEATSETAPDSAAQASTEATSETADSGAETSPEAEAAPAADTKEASASEEA